MRTNSIQFFRQETIIALSFILFSKIFRDGTGSVHGFLFLSQNVGNDFDCHGIRLIHRSINLACPLAAPMHILDCDDKEDLVANMQSQPQVLQSRDAFLRVVQNGSVALTMAMTSPVTEAKAFDGGVGGLGKTKPETGVELFDETSAPIQNDKGIVSSEIKGSDGSPILVSFQTPWPLLPTSGALEARDIRSTESAFVQVVPLSNAGNGRKWKDKKQFQSLLMDSVFAAQGKFGAYGQPFDIQVKSAASNQESSDTDYSKISQFAVTFTTLTPAMRESERKAIIAAQQVGADTLVLLVVTTTSARYSSNQKTFQTIASSFEAIAAPQSSLKKASSSK